MTSPKQQLQTLKAPAPAAFSFVRLPDETAEEYEAFMQYCDSEHDFPARWIAATGSLVSLQTTEVNAWVQRRDQFYQWRMSRLRRKYVDALDRALNDMEERRPYLLKRIAWAAKIEGLTEVRDENMEDEALTVVLSKGGKLNTRIGYAYDKAIRLLNADTELAIKALYALYSPGSVTITNVAAAITHTPEAKNQVSEMAKEWGPVSRPASEEIIDND